MGSWSESCGFSGIEIGEGEVAYCMLMSSERGSLNDGAFIHYAPTTTLLRGTYNDYGYLTVEDDYAILAVFNEQSGLSLKNGDDFSIDHLDGRTERRWWVRGDVLDVLPTLKPEFPYVALSGEGGYKSVKIKNIGESADMWFAKVAIKLEALATQIEDIRSKSTDPELRDLRMEIAMSDIMSDIMGYGDKPGLNRNALMKAIESGDDITAMLTAWRRVWVLKYALIELRKTLAPNESCGPQHGGEIAHNQFARATLAIQKQRKSRWD